MSGRFFMRKHGTPLQPGSGFESLQKKKQQ